MNPFTHHATRSTIDSCFSSFRDNNEPLSQHLCGKLEEVCLVDPSQNGFLRRRGQIRVFWTTLLFSLSSLLSIERMGIRSVVKSEATRVSVSVNWPDGLGGDPAPNSELARLNAAAVFAVEDQNEEKEKREEAEKKKKITGQSFSGWA